MIVTIVKRVKIVWHVDGKLNYPHAATSRIDRYKTVGYQKA